MAADKFTPGNYTLDDLTITTQTGKEVELQNIYAQICVYEDLFSNTMSGNVLVNDAAGLINILPIIGEESLSVSWRSTQPGNEDNITHTFDVFKITDKHFKKQNFASYVLQLASPELRRNVQIRVSKSFLDIKGSAIVKELLTAAPPHGLGMEGTVDIEDTFYNEHMIIPYWTPIEAVNWISRRVMSASNDKAVSYLLFENNAGFHFVSIESLLKKEAATTFAHIPVQGKTTANAILNNVLRFRVDQSFDTYENLQSGMYSGTVLTHDITTKKFKTYTYDYKDAFSETAHMEPNKAIPENTKMTKASVQPAFKIYPKQTDLFDGMAHGDNRAEEWLWRRKSLMQSLQNLKLIIEVKGNSKHKVGDVVNFELSHTDPQNPQSSTPNKYYSGKYLITAIKHRITDIEYTQTLEIIKDSFPTRLANASGG